MPDVFFLKRILDEDEKKMFIFFIFIKCFLLKKIKLKKDFLFIFDLSEISPKILICPKKYISLIFEEEFGFNF